MNDTFHAFPDSHVNTGTNLSIISIAILSFYLIVHRCNQDYVGNSRRQSGSASGERWIDRDREREAAPSGLKPNNNVRGIGRRSTNSNSRGISGAGGSGGVVCGARAINSGRTPRGWKYRRRRRRLRRWRDRDIGSIVCSRFTRRNPIGPILRAVCDITHGATVTCIKVRRIGAYMYIDIHIEILCTWARADRFVFPYWASERAARAYPQQRSLRPLRRDSCLHKS